MFSNGWKKCFQGPKDKISQEQLNYHIYLIRFSHTKALKKKKNRHKTDIFPVLQNLTHIYNLYNHHHHHNQHQNRRQTHRGEGVNLHKKHGTDIRGRHGLWLLPKQLLVITILMIHIFAVLFNLQYYLQYYSMDCYFRQYWRDTRLSFQVFQYEIH